MTEDMDIRKSVLAIVCNFGKVAGDLPPEHDLYADLGIESVNAISILLALEEKFCIVIDDYQFSRARTFNRLVDLVLESKMPICKQSA